MDIMELLIPLDDQSTLNLRSGLVVPGASGDGIETRVVAL
jgi:hypothetical protein